MRGVDRPEEVALGNEEPGPGLRSSELLELGVSSPVSSWGGRRFREDCFGGERGRVVVEWSPLVKRRDMLVVVVEVGNQILFGEILFWQQRTAWTGTGVIQLQQISISRCSRLRLQCIGAQ